MNRILGINSLRFLAALWVMMGHVGGLPLTIGVDKSEFLPKAFWAFYGGFYSGPAAVILFFVISGFCIHWPYRAGAELKVREFYIRRYVRLLLPMAGALLLIRSTLGIPAYDENSWFSGVPAWSLVAEAIYYFIYPLLLKIATGCGWFKVTLASFVIAFILGLTYQVHSCNYPVFGDAGNWLLGLPCWLLGVMLAEKNWDDKTLVVNLRGMWTWRLGAIALGAITHNLGLQLIIGQHLTLNLFAIYCFFWLGREIVWFKNNPPVAWLESAGEWSYSLYLIHIFGSRVYECLGFPFFGHVFNWGIKMVVVLSCAYVFYLLVERPSHGLARRLARA